MEEEVETKGIGVLTVEVVIPEETIEGMVKDKRTRKLMVKLLRKLKKTVQEYVTSSNVRINESTRYLSFKLNQLVDIVKPPDRTTFEKLIYLLSRHNIVLVRCIASTPSMLGPERIRRNLDLSGSSRDLAEKILVQPNTRIHTRGS